MRYFLDTEFNGFGGPLISLALVPEDAARAAFYLATPCEHPTPWVAEHVLPVLEAELVPSAELGRRMAEYLGNDPEPLLMADWPEDIALAARALIAGPGRRHAIDRITFRLCDPMGFDTSTRSAVPHNALHDARALRAFILEREGS